MGQFFKEQNNSGLGEGTSPRHVDFLLRNIKPHILGEKGGTKHTALKQADSRRDINPHVPGLKPIFSEDHNET